MGGSRVQVLVAGAPGLVAALDASGRFDRVFGCTTTSELRALIPTLLQSGVNQQQLVFVFCDDLVADTPGVTMESLIDKLTSRGWRVALLETSPSARVMVQAHPGAGLIPAPMTTNTVLGSLSGMGIGLLTPVADAWGYAPLNVADAAAVIRMTAPSRAPVAAFESSPWGSVPTTHAAQPAVTAPAAPSAPAVVSWGTTPTQAPAAASVAPAPWQTPVTAAPAAPVPAPDPWAGAASTASTATAEPWMTATPAASPAPTVVPAAHTAASPAPWDTTATSAPTHPADPWATAAAPAVEPVVAPADPWAAQAAPAAAAAVQGAWGATSGPTAEPWGAQPAANAVADQPWAARPATEPTSQAPAWSTSATAPGTAPAADPWAAAVTAPAATPAATPIDPWATAAAPATQPATWTAVSPAPANTPAVDPWATAAAAPAAQPWAIAAAAPAVHPAEPWATAAAPTGQPAEAWTAATAPATKPADPWASAAAPDGAQPWGVQPPAVSGPQAWAAAAQAPADPWATQPGAAVSPWGSQSPTGTPAVSNPWETVQAPAQLGGNHQQAAYPTQPQFNRRGLAVAVTVAKGGVGKSSLTLNLGAYLGLRLRELGRTVCIVDANFQQADIGKQINAYTPNIATLVRSMEDLTPERIGRHLLHRPDLNVSFLLGPPSPEEANPVWITPDLYGQCLEVLRRLYDYIIIDCPVAEFHHELFERFVLPAVDFLMVPVEPDIPTIMNTDNWLRAITAPQHAGGNGVDERRIGIVLNKAEEGIGVSTEDVMINLANWAFLGVVPMSKEWRRARNQDEIVATRNYVELNTAFAKILYAITGEQDLLSGQGDVPKPRRFGRRSRKS